GVGENLLHAIGAIYDQVKRFRDFLWMIIPSHGGLPLLLFEKSHSDSDFDSDSDPLWHHRHHHTFTTDIVAFHSTPSPHRKDHGSPDYGRGASPGVNGKGRARNAEHRHDTSPSPRRSSPKERESPEQGAIVSPRSEGLIESPRERSPDAKPDMRRDSPGHSGADSPPGRFH
ncbi:hypothetical protein M8C21_032562, partial [Ambrosia artemisiifolia]